MKFSLYFFLLVFMYPVCGTLTAQVYSREQQKKLSPFLLQKNITESNRKIKTIFSFSVTDTDSAKLWLQKQGASVTYIYMPAKIITAETEWGKLAGIIENKVILFADWKNEPKEELIFGAVDFGTNKITALHHLFPDKNGKDLVVSIKENKFDSTDIDFKGRFISTPAASNTVAGHASIMATIATGGGNSWNNTKGVAWQSGISSASFQNLLPEQPAFYTQYNIGVQNHSYGTRNENFYGAEASGYDASVALNQTLLHIFSAGNSGTLTPASGSYSGIPGYSNLTGNFKQAKNILTVGHTDSFYHVLPPSSKGPAYDGRIKPELVAFGEDGSSGAAAIVSGIALTLQQAYKDLNSGNPAPASLIKAVLLNSADDAGSTGIDYTAGYGSVNALKAMQTITGNRFANRTVINNNTQTIQLTVPVNTKQLKVTLVWTDPQAIPNSSKALVNDLDLELFNPSTNTTWLPWVLSSFPHIDSLQKLPVRKKDVLNNIEQITIDNPAAGNYQMLVKGFSVTTAEQQFSVAWQMDTVDTFQWHHPNKEDHFTNGSSNIIRWQSNYDVPTGTLAYSINNGTSWQTISNHVNLQNGVYQFNPPDIYSTALLRMTIDTNSFVTDTFTFSKRINTSVAYNCTDSFLFTWPKVNGISNYRIYRLGNQYLEPFITTTDTSLLLAKSNNPSLHYAVEPMLNNKPALRSFTFNYQTQGVGCYVANLIADLNANNEAELKLEMGTLLNVQSISFEKLNRNGFELVEKKTIISGSDYFSIDKHIKPGTSSYRVAVQLLNEKIIYSPIVSLYFIGTKPAVLYPNPVPLNTTLTILSKLEDKLTIQLINGEGRIVLEQRLTDFPQQLPLTGLQKGVYYYRLLQEKKKVQSGTIVIL